MNPEKNKIPDNVKTIHFIAICGTGMGALAGMLKDMGYIVTGSDQGVYPPMSDFLARKKIAVTNGFNAKNLSHDPDLVIVGNAVIKNNPEAVATKEKGLFYCSMPQAINHFIVDDKKVLMVTGTHGKTTTSSILAWILHKAGADPSFFIGGILKNFNSNYRLGKGEYIIMEGDEYDTAFFNKIPKFLHYDPFATIITSIEFDHADIFKNLDHIKSMFEKLILKLSHKSALFPFNGDKNVMELTRKKPLSVMDYGKNKNGYWSIGDFYIKPPLVEFEVLKKGEFYGAFETTLMGEHNLLNTLSAIGVADAIGLDKKSISNALKTFTGIKRRQEIRGIAKGVTIMDDFAHHPTAVKETIKAAKPFFPHGKLIAVFEPRTNTSMRKIFEDVYPSAFDEADVVCIRKPSRLDKIPENERIDHKILVQKIKDRGKDAYGFDDTDSIMDFVCKKARPGDLVLIMSNGGFDNIHERLLKRLG